MRVSSTASEAERQPAIGVSPCTAPEAIRCYTAERRAPSLITG
jgi:hypothetical protein